MTSLLFYIAHILVGDGGGSSKTGVANGFKIFELSHNGSHFVAKEVTRHETGPSVVMNCVSHNNAKSIPAFYAGQSIFLTGATGFLRKVIEKILRSCPDVREIFLLMRPRKGLNINERLEEILNLPLYEQLRKQRPENLKKLIPISRRY